MLQSETALAQDEAIEALMALGYTAFDAAKALEDVDASLPTAIRVKQALTIK
jgi:Holliday junction resolvasome RuvABC DNA-binding subunit